MNRAPTQLPERLLGGDATDFERRMLDAAIEKRPSAAASARMARALGVSVTTIGTAAASKSLAAHAAATNATAAAGTSAVWPWVSAGVLGLVVAGAVLGTRAWHASPAKPGPAEHAPPLAPPPPVVPVPSAPAKPVTLGEKSAASVAMPAHPVHATATGVDLDLRAEIALVDSARDALAAGSPQRSLENLRRYQERYPSGSFRPEAAAIRIEALLKLGREDEARTLATRFLAGHRGSLLAKHVAELVGISEPQAAP